MKNQITSLVEYLQKYNESVTDPEGFWGNIADDYVWHKKWDKVLDWNFKDPDVNWFVNGKLNITENIFERNLKERKDQVAIIWEPNDPKDETVRLTYGELHEKVSQFANALKKLGVKKGDRVCLYMQMIPQLPVAMLAQPAVSPLGAVNSPNIIGTNKPTKTSEYDSSSSE